MKKLGIAIILTIFGGLHLTMAQQGNTEMRQYFEEEIKPVLETEQQIFYEALTTEELEKIVELKANMNEQTPNKQKGKSKGNSGKKGKQGHRKGFSQTSTEEASKIAEAHPKEVEHFQKAIAENKEKWIEDITALRSKSSQGSGKGRQGTGSNMFSHISDPAWLLLWDKDMKNRGDQRKGEGNHGRNGKNANDNCEGKGVNSKGGGMRNGMGPNQNVNPELRAELRDYARDNIIPVIAQERTTFDSQLSVSEKEQIALAQGKRKARRIMFQEWYKSEDFESGARRDDPNFDIMREDMQKSMKEIRNIADIHENEIDKALDNIRSYADSWETDIKQITDKYSGHQGKRQSQSRKLQQMLNPVHFLLFNPEETENTALFDMDRKDMVEVSILPNPMSTYGTIRIRNAHNMQTEVKLYTKEGELLETLYSEMVIGEEISFGLSVSDLDSGIYILKLSAAGNELARKIIVQK